MSEPQHGKRGLLSAINDFLRWLLFVVLVTAAAAALVLYVVQVRLDEEIRSRIESRFQANYPQLRVTVQSARRISGVGIEIRGIRVSEPSRDEPRRLWPLAYVDEMLIRCSTELGDLVAGQACAQEIVFRRPQLAARCRPDGRWNLAALLPLPQFGAGTPDLVIEDAAVEIQYGAAVADRRLRFDNVHLTVTPIARPTGGKDAAASLRQFCGQMRSNLFASAALDGQLDLANFGWSAQGGLQGLETSADALAVLPSEWAARLQPLTAFRGQTHINFRAAGVGAAPARCRLAVAGVSRGRIEDPRLPQPLTNVEAEFRCNNDLLQLDRLTARAGETLLQLAGRWSQFAHGGHLQLRGTAEKLAIDERLVRFLPANWQCIWPQVAPRGTVNAMVDVGFDGTHWTQDLLVDCLDVSVTYHRFPYPLHKLRGRVHYRNGTVDLQDLHASANGRVVEMKGQLVHPGPQCTGWFEFLLKDPLPLDEQLLSAIVDEHAQRVVRALDPHGAVTAWGRYERSPADLAIMHKRLEIGLTDCSINYDRFRYPLYRIRGALSMSDDRWTFRDLEGWNDSGWVACSGSWEPAAAGGTTLALNFNAADVPLEDELRDALQPEFRRIWTSLCPRGTIDQLKASLRYNSKGSPLSLEVTVEKRPPEQNVEGRSISIKPSWLPYSWDNVIGVAHFRDGNVQLQNVRATHGDTSVGFSGQVQTDPQGPWRVRLAPFNVDRIDATRELVTALPTRLGYALSRLDVSGLVSVSGSLEVTGDRKAPTLPTATWNLEVDLEDGALNCGDRFEHIHGGIQCAGQFNGTTVVSSGELAIDSLIYKGVQLTRISGPVRMEDANVWLGEWIPEGSRGPVPCPLTATLWGGTLSGSGQAQLGTPAQFELDVELVEGDLSVISQEATLRQRKLSGRTFATVLLSGSSEGAHTWRGRGRVLLREADIYELPVMVRTLKLVTGKPPDRTAFTSSDVDFRIEADRIYFDRIDFDGDAVSLDGRGEMSLDRQVSLTFGTTVGRDDYYTALVRPILKEAGRQLMVIEVSGTLDDPQVHRKPVPQLSERLQQIFPAEGEGERPQTTREAGLKLFPLRWR